jgi:hypothetical protein
MLPDAETFADQILDVTNQRNPPTDIRGILGRWPHLSVVETDLDGDGMFIDLGDIGGEILVRKDKHETRKRFTIAHELGHFLLRHHLQEPSEHHNMESWCNNFAAGVLLPKKMVLHHLRMGGLSKLTERLIEGPSLFQVSEKAFYLRVTRLFPISIFTFLLSASSAVAVESFQNQEIEQLVGNYFDGIDQETKDFLMRFLERQITFEQYELRKLDTILVARELRSDASGKKIMLAALKR